MKKSLKKILRGYHTFRKKYASGNRSIMHLLAKHGQSPDIMVVSCCDSRVDPALILQCDPGDLFVVRNVANIVPPFEKDEGHHGVSAALEFGVCFLKVKHLIILGHSQCGGIHALLNEDSLHQDDFISRWVSVIKRPHHSIKDTDECAKLALVQSYENCLAFPWIKKRVSEKTLAIHLWFFDISQGEIFSYSQSENNFQLLN